MWIKLWYSIAKTIEETSMMLRKSVFLAVTGILYCAGGAYAHHPSGGVGLGQSGPVRTTAATTLPAGTFTATVQAEFIDMDTFSNSQLRGFSGEGKDAHTTDSTFHAILGLGYGITDNLTLSITVPYAQVNNIREVHGDEPDEIHQHGDSKGIGDMTVIAQYRFLKTDDALDAAVFGGLSIPTGKTNEKDIHGETFEAEFLPGSGAWSPLFGIAATKRFGRVSFDANVQYMIRNGGTQETNLGDVFTYNAAVSYRAVSGDLAWDLILEANGEWKEKQKVRGTWDGNSGGNMLFISPGTRLIIGRKVSAFFSFGIPVLQDLNGIQDDVDYKTLFGFSFSL